MKFEVIRASLLDRNEQPIKGSWSEELDINFKNGVTKKLKFWYIEISSLEDLCKIDEKIIISNGLTGYKCITIYDKCIE